MLFYSARLFIFYDSNSVNTYIYISSSALKTIDVNIVELSPVYHKCLIKKTIGLFTTTRVRSTKCVKYRRKTTYGIVQKFYRTRIIYVFTLKSLKLFDKNEKSYSRLLFGTIMFVFFIETIRVYIINFRRIIVRYTNL